MMQTRQLYNRNRTMLISDGLMIRDGLVMLKCWSSGGYGNVLINVG